MMTQLERGIEGFVGAVAQLAFQVFRRARLPRGGGGDHGATRLAAGDPRHGVGAPARDGHRDHRADAARARAHLSTKWTRIYWRFGEVLTGIVTVKSFAMEEAEKSRFLVDVKHTNHLVVRGIGIDATVNAGQSLVVTLARVVALALGG